MTDQVGATNQSELQKLLSDFIANILLHKPSDVYSFSRNYFSTFHQSSTQQQTKAPSNLRPVVINGPSGVGKGTLIEKLLKENPNSFGFSVSHTTRKPRNGEVDGVHYHFSTVESMKAEIEEKKFVEFANVVGNYYGTSKAAVQRVAEQGKVCILDIDVQGAEQVKKSDLNPRYVFIAPPSFEELEKRLRGRATETEEAIVKRLANAKKELEYMNKPGFYDKVIVNDNLEKAYQELKDFIYS